jgi:hypothetical protein
MNLAGSGYSTMLKSLKQFFKNIFSPESSPKLKRFYKEYAKWLNDDAPEDHKTFARCYGLCGNLVKWCDKDSESLLAEMQKQFRKEGLCPILPFNDSLNFYQLYTTERIAGKCHLNEKRRQWVFEHTK